MSTSTVKTPEEIDKEQAEKVTSKPEAQKTDFDRYLDELGVKYTEKCKEMAQKMEFQINIRDADGKEKPRKFARKHLTQAQLEKLEDLRAYADELNKSKKGSKEQRQALRQWYIGIGKFCLYDVVREEFMSEEDFDNAVSKDIRPILDGCILAEMSGVPN